MDKMSTLRGAGAAGVVPPDVRSTDAARIERNTPQRYRGLSSGAGFGLRALRQWPMQWVNQMGPDLRLLTRLHAVQGRLGR